MLVSLHIHNDLLRKLSTQCNLSYAIIHQLFSPAQALNGFMMMITQTGKLLFITENASEYLGHSMEDLLIHGDSIYDIVDKQDHPTLHVNLAREGEEEGGTEQPKSSIKAKQQIFLCRINVSRNARRQMRFGDQKVILVKGHFYSSLPLCSRDEPVFVAHCSPLAMPENRDIVVQVTSTAPPSPCQRTWRFSYK